ncbi:MAG: O-methyltransferase [Mycoplasmoidaceae bacterium]
MKKMTLKKLKIISMNYKIPIVRDNTIKYIDDIIKKNCLYHIFEVGTGFGYSSCYLAHNNKSIKIETIENNIFNYLMAKNNNCSNIDYIFGSIYDWVPKKKYDLVFIDGPKSKQKLIFNKFRNSLTNKGIIIIDNIYLHNVPNITKNQRKLHQKNTEFVEFLSTLNDFRVKIINIDDGIAVCRSSNNENSN